MNIINFKNLAGNSLREKALLIAETGYEAIEIKKAVSKRISLENGFLTIKHFNFEEKNETKIDLNSFERIFIVGIGKGSALASEALAEILGKYLFGGVALDIKKPSFLRRIRLKKLKFYKGTHPLPSKMNIKATQGIIKLAEELNEKDLLITFICGGGSALACASESELLESSCATKELTKAGADIVELNTVRKHLSEFKGGNLAKIACPAQIVSLIVSDICGNELSMVASGPTVLDKTTKNDAENILKKYSISPGSFNLRETPKDIGCFENIKNILFACNQDVVMAMMEKSKELGFNPKIHSLALEGEAREILKPMIEKINFGEAIIAAGETTVTLTANNTGKGGRNQESVLGALAKCQRSSINCQDFVFLSFTSDAHDNTEAAGAIGDSLTIEEAKKLNLNLEDFLENHDSFNFFKKTGDLIYAEQKCFNVADLMLVLSLPKE
ncbi:MAG: DUF4147 domain-containing protein [Patescibacteria group bacterium]